MHCLEGYTDGNKLNVKNTESYKSCIVGLKTADLGINPLVTNDI